MSDQTNDAWANRPYAAIGDKIQELIEAKWIVDIWDHDERTVRVRISDLKFSKCEIDISKNLIDDPCFDVAEYVLSECNRAIERARAEQ